MRNIWSSEYRHSDGNTYTSRGWWIAEQLTQAVPGGSVLSSQGVRQAREMVPGRPTSVFMPALHRTGPPDDSHEARRAPA